MSSQIWFITGASNGIGLAVTKYVLSQGGTVVATVRNAESLKSLQSLIEPARLLVVKVDVKNPEDIDTAFDRAKSTFGRIDVVYNNAGYSAVGEVEATPVQDGKDMFETNFWGATHVSLAAVNFFREINNPIGGRLIQASSIYGLTGMGANGYYAASKFALEGMTECLMAELDLAWNIKESLLLFELQPSSYPLPSRVLQITLAEFGFFRTNFVLNHTYSVYSHPAYTNPLLLGNRTRAMLADVDPAIIKGDPDQLAKRLYELAQLDDPPTRIFLGEEGPALWGKKMEEDKVERKKWESWAYGLTFRD